MPLTDYEEKIALEGYGCICGVDEAGRGPLAGPVVVSAVILKDGAVIPGLDDSKKLTEKKREELFNIIVENSVAYKIVFIDEKTIDDINILAATMLGMKRAVEGLSIVPDICLIDGNSMPDVRVPARCVIHGDAMCRSIAAASVLAKVSRDRYMAELHERYPQYDFLKHKGYPTALHYKKIDEFGVSDVHRLSFLKKYFAKKG